MRFLITAQPGPSTRTASDAGQAIDEKVITAAFKYNEELHKAGVLIASEGLNPTVKGARILVSGGKRTVVDGPFTEAKELLGGFYLIEVQSREEAIAWALKCPVGLGFDDVLDIHPLTSAADIPPEIHALLSAAAPTWSATFSKPR